MSLPVEQRIDYAASLCGACHRHYGDWQFRDTRMPRRAKGGIIVISNLTDTMGEC